MAVKLFKPKSGSIATFNKDGLAISSIKNITGTNALLVTYKDGSQEIFENYNYFINHLGIKETYDPTKFNSIGSFVETYGDQLNVGDIIYYNNDFVVVDQDLINNLIKDTTMISDIFNDGSCIATYPFDGNANDLSGKHNGTWYGNEQYDVGKFNQAAKFDGNSYIETDILLNIGYTVNFWVRSDYNGVIFGAKNATNDGNNWNIFMTNFNGGNCDAHYNYNFAEKEWYMITIQFPSNNISDIIFYVNGAKQTTYVDYDSNNIRQDGNNYLLIGKDYYRDFLALGLVDQIRIFNRILTADEIQELYNEQSGSKIFKLAL